MSQQVVASARNDDSPEARERRRNAMWEKLRDAQSDFPPIVHIIQIMGEGFVNIFENCCSGADHEALLKAVERLYSLQDVLQEKAQALEARLMECED